VGGVSKLSPKRIVRIENWEYHEQRIGRKGVLTGDVYGHALLLDGATLLATSEILGKRGMLVETQNTLYDLGKHSGQGMGRAELMATLEEVAA
jgi:hypothetical protein